MNRKTRRLPKKNTKSGKKIFFIIILLAIFFIFSGYNNFKNTKVESTRNIIVKEKSTFSTLGKTIPELESFWYNIYLKNNSPDFALQAGTYELKKGDNLTQMFESLQKPITNSRNITILEGWNVFDIDEKLTSVGLISKGEYINYVTNPEKIEALREFFPFLRDINLETLEGYLSPETYTVNPDEFGVNILVIAQLEAFENKVYKKLLENKYSNQEIYELINLASIVEKEEKIKENKKIVAGILKKRLESNWQIGADATICYPYKLTSEECKLSVTKYLYEKNEYNTRQKTGLPKTPIANPDYETIEATVNLTDTKYWFYLHDITTGAIYYAETNAEHERNKAKYIR